MEELLVPLFYIAVPAIILMIAFVAFLRKEEEEIEEDLIHEHQEEERIRDEQLRAGN